MPSGIRALGRRVWEGVRRHKWGLLAWVVCFVVYEVVWVGDPSARFAGGDGFYSWMYARSIVFDGDIDFKNDYAICGDMFQKGIERGTGHPDNPFYAGPALYWVPLLKLARAVVHVPTHLAQGYHLGCYPPLSTIPLGVAPVLGAFALLFAYLAARRFASDRAAALALVLIGLSGPTIAYATSFSAYSHVYAAFGVSVLLWTTLRMFERPTLVRILVVAFGIFLTVTQRPQLVFLGMLPLVAAFQALRARRRMLVVAILIFSVGLLLGVLPTLAINKFLYGRIDVVPQGRNYLHLAHAHPLLLLFGHHGGLFYHSPATWLSVLGIGAVFRDRARRALLLALLFAMAMEIWISSSPLDWGGAWSLGARRLMALNPLFVLLAAALLTWVGRTLVRRPRRLLFLAGIFFSLPLAATGVGTAFAYAEGKILVSAGPSQAELYGTGAQTAWKYMGGVEPALLPAQLYFMLRYRLPPTAYRQALNTEEWYFRNYANLAFIRQDLPTTAAGIGPISRGFQFRDAGMVLAPQTQGRIVFCPNWPFATALDIDVSGPRGARLRGGIGRWFGGARWFDSSELGVSHGVVRLKFGEGDFDSGLLELVFENQGSLEMTIHGIRIVDETRHLPSF